MAQSEERLLRRTRRALLSTNDHVLKNSLIYICGSCLLLVVVFLTLLPGALFNYLRRVHFLKGVIADDVALDASDAPRRFIESRSPAIFCHLNLTAFSRLQELRYSVYDVPANRCTHVVYPLHGLQDWFDDMLNYDAYQSAAHPTLYSDMEYLRKNYKTKVLVYVDTRRAHPERYNLLEWVGQTESMAMLFARNLYKWLRSNRLDGVVLEGMFPTPEEERRTMSRLLKKLYTLFKQTGMTLVIVVPADIPLLRSKIHGRHLSQNVHYVAIRNYDSERPVYEAVRERMVGGIDGLKKTVSAVLATGAASKKLLTSLALDGLSFRVLENDTVPGMPGPYTNHSGVLAYFEVCSMLRDTGWRRMVIGGNPVAFKGHDGVSYEDPDSIGLKMSLVRNHSLGGALLWDVTSDDYRGLCGEINPITRVISDALSSTAARTK
ncbi:chitinase-3-like protein 1 [Ornithodoros turicata]|uniref:chitinase-3-like protein 1 n=1 Tax=Ornithodoros turicata TaxID=34597 RepID=UPI00313899F4